MRTILTIFGSLFILSAAIAETKEVRSLPQEQRQIFDTKKDPAILEKLLNKNVPQALRGRTGNNLGQSQGGATSGGGDELGLEVARVLDSVTQMISADSDLYQPAVKQAILNRSQQLKIIITDDPLPASTEKIAQYGAAYSIYDGKTAVMLIQREKWMNIESPLIKDKLIHHELSVLAGVETTGDYRYTNIFATNRAKLWERLRSKKFVCTFSLYEKSAQTVSSESGIGSLLGSAGVVVNNRDSVLSDISVLYNLQPQVDGAANRAVALAYVVSSDGYLRAQLSEADVVRYKNNKKLNAFSNFTKKSQEKIYFSPYDLVDAGRSSDLESWGNYYVQVGCSKL